jgi:hypothetical protein
MSVYNCDNCGRCFDADFHGIEQHALDDFKCVCEDCYDKIIEPDEET